MPSTGRMLAVFFRSKHRMQSDYEKGLATRK